MKLHVDKLLYNLLTAISTSNTSSTKVIEITGRLMKGCVQFHYKTITICATCAAGTVALLNLL